MPKRTSKKPKPKGRSTSKEPEKSAAPEPTAPPEPAETPPQDQKRRLNRREAQQLMLKRIKDLDMTKEEWKIARQSMLRDKSYAKFQWFWGMISQSEAEHFLRREGDRREGLFLVRSEMKDLTNFIVSVLHADRWTVSHFQAVVRGSHWKLASFPTRHDTIVDMVQHFQTHHAGDLRLKYVADKPEWLIKKRKIIAPKSAKILGSGAFSDVIIGAFQRRLVAIKVLTAKGDHLAVERDKMMHEAMMMKALQHPYITKMIGIALDECPPMLLMEMMVGTLEKHLETCGAEIEFGEKLLYCWQIASGMTHMAENEMVHRDLATRNVLISRYGTLKIADFGLSNYAAKVATVKIPGQMPVRWMAPESFGDAPKFSEKSDVWAFGVTCNEIFENGRIPCSHLDTNQEVIFLALEYPKLEMGDVPIHLVSRQIPEEVANILKNCWERDPKRRSRFKSHLRALDVLLKISYPPPLPDELSVNRLAGCRPLTISEYESLYYGNQDWSPPVRKAPMRKRKRHAIVKMLRQRMVQRENEKKELEKARAAAGADEVSTVPRRVALRLGFRLPRLPIKKRNPRAALSKYQKALRRRVTRRQLRGKLDIFRHRRRENRRKTRLLTELQMERMGGTENRDLLVHREVTTRIRKKCQRIVELYWKMCEVKWRKMAPTRETRLRLRPARQINGKSRNPISRNGKAKRIKVPAAERSGMPPVKKPMFPEMPEWKSHGITRPGVDDDEEEQEKKEPKKKKKLTSEEKKKMAKRRKRQLGRRERRLVKNGVRQLNRQKRRALERRRRRRKARRRFRRLKRRIREEALSWQQVDRFAELTVRRREREKRMNRRHRDAKIGKVLRDWATIRRKMVFAVDRRVALKLRATNEAQVEFMKKYRKEEKREKTKETKRKKKKGTKRASKKKET